jgi:hypothetical protein
MTSAQYVKAALANVEAALDESDQCLSLKATTPMQASYRPEPDTSAEFKLEGMRNNQELIGVFRWAIKIGWIDIAIEVLTLPTQRST